jgi:hypothetical protein
VLPSPQWPSISYCTEYLTNKPWIKYPECDINNLPSWISPTYDERKEKWHWVALWTISCTTYSFFSSPLDRPPSDDLSYHHHPCVSHHDIHTQASVSVSFLFITIWTQHNGETRLL